MAAATGLLSVPFGRLVAGTAWLLLAACALGPPAAEPPPSPLQWPAAPESARVQFVQSIAKAEDLGIRKSWLQRLGDFVFGASTLRLVRPMAVVESAGVIYVGDPGAQGVHRFDRASGSHTLVRAADGSPLPSPVGLAVGRGKIFVADSVLRKVLVVQADGAGAVELPLQASLVQPTGVAADPVSGRIIVADTGAHRLLIFEADGSLVRAVGQRGLDDGQFNFPTMLWLDGGGRLYVSDTLNFRVQVLDNEGRFLAKFGRAGDGGGDMARHKGVATDSWGHIYVVDGLHHAVQIFDPDGRWLLGVGAQGRDAGEFWLPVGVYIGADDTIYVADTYNRRVQVFRYVGARP